MKLSILSKLCLFGFAAWSLQARAEIRTDYLSNIRDQIKFNELNATDKRTIAEQAQLLLRDLYVEREEKNNYYGNYPSMNQGHVDPALSIQQLINHLDKLSTRELHQQLSQIFINQRDRHLNYIFPLPHSAFKSYLPLTLTRTHDGSSVVRVEQLLPVFDSMLPSTRKPEVGDQLLEYDELPTQKAINKLMPMVSGANPYGGFSRALEYMTQIDHALNLPPAHDTALLKLRSARTGEAYTIQLPWLVEYDDAKLLEKTENIPAQSPNPKPPSKMQVLDQKEVGAITPVQRSDIEHLYFATNTTADPAIEWAIIPKGNVAYLGISRFQPINDDADQSLNIIAHLLREQLADTNALLIDVRNNGGGDNQYVDKLLQIFTPGPAHTNAVRLLNTKLNAQFLNQDVFRAFQPKLVKLIDEAAKTNNTYTQTTTELSLEEANSLGQMYYKPVGILTNARSYSATEMFSCAMQDNGAATLYGEDPLTGGGGSNPIPHSVLAENGPAWFKPLPGGVQMRFSWLQTIRDGYHKNELIEDEGCAADVNVPRTFSDLTNGDKTQLDKITTHLLSKPPPRSLFKFVHPVADVIEVEETTTNLDIQTAETEYVQVYVDHELFKSLPVYSYGAPQTVRLPLPAMRTGQSYTLRIVGIDAGHTPRWNTQRSVRVIAQK
ncbi:S41 family peptidase [Andreprevotia chitinilytica]|uniref:S41 family peptidase n=1 Tax=Andreprevotia chitinilytica TaxID=396808 RepID=UPI000A05DF70|nr:S41 family peptidase [Andreprevotia chitinilytica]